jgi:hypothetical protein
MTLRGRQGIRHTDCLIRALRLFWLARYDVAILGPRKRERDVICDRGQMRLLVELEQK